MDKLQTMTEGGKRLHEVREAVVAKVIPGIKLIELEQLADSLINKSGGEAAFKQVPGYNWVTCININEGVVHGIPNEYEVRDGDVVSVDVGMIYQGWYTDTSTSVIAGKADTKKEKLIKVGREALAAAIAQARAGNRVGHISEAMERVLKAGGMSPVKKYTGHGIGRNLHEWPSIPCFVEGNIDQTPLIHEGMALAIEAIYTSGKPETKTDTDGWTVVAADGSLAGLFEDTVYVTAGGAAVLT